MSLITNWGYTLTDVSALPDMLDEDEFNEATYNKYTGDSRITPSIQAAQAAIRNYVGWHLAGSLDCEYEGNSEDISGVIQLPARYVTAVKSVAIGGATLDPSEYDWKPMGLIRLYRPHTARAWNDVVVDYTAGLTEPLVGAIKELIVHRVTHALAQPYGVQSESAGGVSITYSANWINSARATALPDDNKEVLQPYKLQGVY